jgi:hypothetical protein
MAEPHMGCRHSELIIDWGAVVNYCKVAQTTPCATFHDSGNCSSAEFASRIQSSQFTAMIYARTAISAGLSCGISNGCGSALRGFEAQRETGVRA